ncbi:MAG TPA: branched-chain amino acid ABC transporter permease [Anaeromyxobacteraceae bacterium]
MRWRSVPLALLAIAAALLPLALASSFVLHVCILVLMWTLLGAAWNVLGGFAGQVSFGHASLFGVGAYATMILFLKAGLAPWWGIPLGGLAAALTSLPIGLLCFRLRGPYFSLATLAVAEIFRLAALNWDSLTNGPVGFLITALPPLRVAGHTVDWETKPPFYLLAALLAGGALLATAALKRSRLGAYLLAIREDEDAAEAVGIDTVRAKVLTLALSAFLAGLGGGFYAFYFRYVDPDAVLNIALSMEMVFIAMVGGLGTVGGPLIGALFLTALAETMRQRLQVGHLVVYGLCMMLIIRFLPEGIWGRAHRLLTRRGPREVPHGAPGS